MTSKTFTGDLKTAGHGATGIEGADNLCAEAAAAGGLGGSWFAWISTRERDVYQALAPNTSYSLLNGERAFRPNNPSIIHEIDIDERGLTLPPLGQYIYPKAWTGTMRKGRRMGDCNDSSGACGKTCQDFTTTSGQGTHGCISTAERLSTLDYNFEGWWTECRYFDDCSQEKHLYCFEK